MTDAASLTLQVARALTRRLAGAPAVGPCPMPELEALVRPLLTRARWRSDAGDGRFAPIAARAQAWGTDGCRHDALIRLALDYVSLLDAGGARTKYGMRVAAELDDALALAPSIVMLPSFETLDMVDLLRLRATSARVVGLRDSTTMADGDACTPSEFFWHDVDHLRFMVREDLAVLGVAIPDAYGAPDRDGRRTTFDAATGGHRRVLAAAVAPLVARRGEHARLMQRAAATVDGLLSGLARCGGGQTPDVAAACVLLFEICHEKSLTPVPEILRRELAGEPHIVKVRSKLARRFWGEAVDPGLADHLVAGRALLLRLLAEEGAA
ncbi:hypothetical protein [Vineibacter terrae]|uniref:hypothetical protein n=1 Tax=Vineibacter terrae TaxID=2586908 RepID=UPI0015B6065F|nr:hypothetical protein [Vineibacter terrae]